MEKANNQHFTESSFFTTWDGFIVVSETHLNEDGSDSE